MPDLSEGYARKRVLAISSQVVRGHIGLSAIVPALQVLGHEVWPMPTILLSNHPGHRVAAGVRTPVETLDAMLDALAGNGWLGEVDAVLTGYLPSAEHVAFAARAVARVRQLKPQATVLVDPVLGDDPKGLYIDPAAATAMRDILVPLASIVTPNRFELGWLTGLPVSSLAAVGVAARSLPVRSCAVTSAAVSPERGAGPDSMDRRITTLMISGGTAVTATAAWQPRAPHGTGDLFAGLMLASLLHGRTADEAVARAVAGVSAAIEASAGRDELATVVASTVHGAAPVPTEPFV